MGLWDSIKSALGMKSEPVYPIYYPPPPVMLRPVRINRPDDEEKHWEELKKRWDERMEWERVKRSRYGGG